MTTDQAFRSGNDFVRPTRAEAESLSDAALEMATKNIERYAAADTLVEHAQHDRRLMASTYERHVQRMASRRSDDFVYQRALDIIAAALHQIPRDPYPPFDASPARPSFFRRLLSS